MAYSIQKPSGSGSTSISRPSSISSYSGALQGFSNDLATLRKQIISEQSAAIDYNIEVGASSIEEKIALYETYLSGLEDGTQEWYRVAKKIEDLKDSASSQDFALVKSLYAGGQMSTEEYYNVLRERAGESNISDKEKQSRVLELKSFEDKIKDENTDKALRESLIQEELGLISAAERLNLIKTAYDNEEDPDRRASLERQLVTQGKKVRSEELQRQELIVKKGINTGVATKADLIPIYEARAATALTENERLAAEVSLQDLIQGIASDQASAVKKAGNDNVKYVKGLVNDLDRQIEEAKRKGDLPGLYLLYGKKTQYIDSFYSGRDPLTGDAMTLTEDDMSVSSFEQFMEDVHGIKITDPLTGDFVEVGTDKEFSFFDVERAVTVPQSYGLAISFRDGGKDASYKLVEGTRIGDSFVYGDYVQVSQQFQTDPKTGEIVRDENGVPQLLQVNPTLLERKRLSDAERRQLELEVSQKNQKLPKGFTGEYIERTDINGKVSREWIIDDAGLDRVAGAAKYSGLGENEFALTSFDGSIPTRQTVKDQKLHDNLFVKTGAAIQEALGLPGKILQGQLTTPLGRLNQSLELQQQVQAGGSVPGIDLGFDPEALKEKINKVKESFAFNFSPTSQPLVDQFQSSLFKPSEFADVTLKAITSRSYTPVISYATKQIASAVLNSSPLGEVVQGFQKAKEVAGNAFGKVKSFFGFGN